jgi:hypothetical protein
MAVTANKEKDSALVHSLLLKTEAVSTPKSWWNNPRTKSTSIINHFESLKSVRI